MTKKKNYFERGKVIKLDFFSMRGYFGPKLFLCRFQSPFGSMLAACVAQKPGIRSSQLLAQEQQINHQNNKCLQKMSRDREGGREKVWFVQKHAGIACQG